MGLVALGGMAIGIVAIGGLAVGVYAAGGFEVGKHIISEAGSDPTAVEFFTQHAPWLLKNLGVGRP